MKIGFVLDDGLDSVDGVQQYILTLGEWYTSKGHNVHYIVGQTKRTDVKNVHSLARNIRVRFNKNRLAIPVHAPQKKISRLLERESFDVLHIQMPYSPQYGGKVINLAPKQTAIVGTFHILPYGALQSVGSRMLATTWRKSRSRIDDVVSVSPAAQEFAKRTMNIDSTVVPNAVNLKKFNRGELLSKYADGVQTIMFLGRLVERKGCMELLHAIHKLIKTNRFEDRRLVICGAGPLKKKIHSYIRDHALGQYIECVGKISETEKPNYLASADLAVFPSKSGESFGIVLVEAIASGARAVLGGDNPGYRFVLAERTDALINPKNISQFADRIDELLSDKTRAQKLGNCQKSDIEQFDVETVGAKLLSIYESSIAKEAHKHNNS